MLINEKRIAVDSGKFATKFAMNTAEGVRKGSFRTKLSPWNGTGSAGADSHIVTLEGKTWVIGEAASDSSVSFDTSKASDLHRMSVYTAAALLADNNDSIILGIGCPLRNYYNEKDRENYLSSIAPAGKIIDITVDGVRKHFIIHRSSVFAESSGVISSDPAGFMRSTVGVIDIGGLNVNAIIYKHMHPVIETYISEEAGGNVLSKTIRDAFQERFNAQLKDYVMDDILRKGYSGSRISPEEQKKLVKEYKKKHAESILNDCKKAQWPLDFLDIRFCGGASVFLKDELKEVFGVDDSSFVPDAEYANVLGFMARL